MEWTQTYPGLPSMVPAIRAFVRGLLIDGPRVHEAELVVAELAANSLRHAPGGGDVTVTVTIRSGRARVAVADSGTGPWIRGGTLDDYERGLFLLAALADKAGHDVHDGGQTMWAEFAWDGVPSPREKSDATG